MKKIILTALIAVSSLAANAQVFLGGSVGFGVSKETKDAKSMTTLSIMPTIGYNFNDSWALVVDLSESYAKKGDANTNTFGIGAKARWSCAKVDNFTFFLDGGLGYQTTNKDGDNFLQIGIVPGVKYAVTKNVEFITKIGFLGYTKQLNNEKGSDFGLKFNTNALSFGMLYNF